MPIRDLTNEEALRLITSYQNALNAALNQPNNEEDIALLNHMVSNVSIIKKVMQVQPPSNKLTWKIMTFITGAPQVLNSTQTHALQYDSDKNINQNIQSLNYNLLLNNAMAAENLKNHINRNNNIEIISGLLTIISIILSELIAPWSAWGVSFLIPLYSTLALPLIVILFLSIGIEIASRLHSSTLRELYLKHEILKNFENNIDQHGISNEYKTVKFFQASNSNNLLSQDNVLFDSQGFGL